MLMSTCHSKYCKCDCSFLKLVWKNQTNVTTVPAGDLLREFTVKMVFAFSSGVLLCFVSSVSSLIAALLLFQNF